MFSGRQLSELMSEGPCKKLGRKVSGRPKKGKEFNSLKVDGGISEKSGKEENNPKPMTRKARNIKVLN